MNKVFFIDIKCHKAAIHVYSASRIETGWLKRLNLHSSATCTLHCDLGKQNCIEVILEWLAVHQTQSRCWASTATILQFSRGSIYLNGHIIEWDFFPLLLALLWRRRLDQSPAGCLSNLCNPAPSMINVLHPVFNTLIHSHQLSETSELGLPPRELKLWFPCASAL